MKRDDASHALLTEAQELGHENRAGSADQLTVSPL